MPNFSVTNVFGAAGVVANVFAGSAFEFINRPSRVAIAMATTVTDTAVATIQFGPEVQLEEGILPIEALAGRGPLLPDDILVDDVAAGGDRLVGRVTANAACTVKTRARILPIQ